MGQISAHIMRLGTTVILTALALLGGLVPRAGQSVTLTIGQQPQGKSTCYIGAVEGDTRFDIHDLTDLGINSYRIFAGIPRWEPTNDSKVYGQPDIATIKANPDSINWAAWDAQMLHHDSVPGISDASIFGDLLAAHIRPIVVLRNRDDTGAPTWLPNPPTTQADWNEWWAHVFAAVYWLNVRHHYNVNDFEIHDDPDTPDQGWSGTEEQYATLVKMTTDAISYVYETYLPGQTYHIYAPDTTYANGWVADALTSYPTLFDTVDYHQYSFGAPFAASISYAHQMAADAGQGDKPLWISEWGTYDAVTHPGVSVNDQPAYGVAAIDNLIAMSQPGQDYVLGSDYYALYDTNKHPQEGLIASDGTHRTLYYALRLGIRALQGCKATYDTQTGDPTMTAITTTDGMGGTFLLVTNTGTDEATVAANLAPLMTAGATATLYRYDATTPDTSAPLAMAQPGHVAFSLPPTSAALVQLRVPVAAPPTPAPVAVPRPTAVAPTRWILLGTGASVAVVLLLSLWLTRRRGRRARVVADPLVARERQRRSAQGVSARTNSVPDWLDDDRRR